MVITTTLCALALTLPLGEEEYYEIATIPIPDEIVLEVSAIEILKDGTALVATRRGDDDGRHGENAGNVRAGHV